MRKRTVGFLLPLFLAVWILWPPVPSAAEKRPVVIAALLYGKSQTPSLEGLKAGLREKGYVEGMGVEYVYDGPIETIEELDAAMARLLAKKPDLVYAAGTAAAQAAQKATKGATVPVLFGPVNDAVGAGLVKDRKHPGENITGVMLADSEGKRLQWITEFAPKAKKILVPYNPEDKSAVLSLQSAKEAAVTLKLDLLATPIRTPEELDALVAQFPADIDAVFVPRDGLIMSRIKGLLDLSLRNKFIVSVIRVELVEKGALYSYGFDGFELGKQLSRLAVQIFRGKRPGDLPVETAENHFVVNQKTAKAIGLTIPTHILRIANRVIRPE